jgi:pyrroloquinoline quinone biosynthesis protein B
MVIRLLGSAAGGGVPQWNCGCRQCALARAELIEKRTQCSVAVSANCRQWFLVNASADLRLQLLSLPVQPLDGRRETLIESVLLTDADLDHALGLFLLRESDSSVPVCASRNIREALDEGLRLTEVLRSYGGLDWVEARPEFTPLRCRGQLASGLEYKAVQVTGPGPRYCRNGHGSCRLAYVIRDVRTAGCIVIAPAVAALEAQLVAEMMQADAILFDGTFWSSDDFEKSGVHRPDVEELLQGHLPILNGSLPALVELPARQKIYIHLNNTNPVLSGEGPERKQLDALNIRVGNDGMEFEL